MNKRSRQENNVLIHFDILAASHICGWVTLRDGSSVTSLMLVVDKLIVCEFLPNVDRVDVSKLHGGDIRCGFDYLLGSAVFGRAKSAGLLVNRQNYIAINLDGLVTNNATPVPLGGVYRSKNGYQYRLTSALENQPLEMAVFFNGELKHTATVVPAAANNFDLGCENLNGVNIIGLIGGGFIDCVRVDDDLKIFDRSNSALFSLDLVKDGYVGGYAVTYRADGELESCFILEECSGKYKKSVNCAYDISYLIAPNDNAYHRNSGFLFSIRDLPVGQYSFMSPDGALLSDVVLEVTH